MVKKIGKRGKAKKSKQDLMRPYVDFMGLAWTLKNANLEDYNEEHGDLDSYVEEADRRKMDLLYDPDSKKSVPLGLKGSRGKKEVINNLAMLERLEKCMNTAEYYEVDPLVTKHLQETDALELHDEEFKLPFGRCFFSVNLKVPAIDATITGVAIERKTVYVTLDEEDDYVSVISKEKCTCGLERHMHKDNYKEADDRWFKAYSKDCKRFTWDGKHITKGIEGYAIFYRWEQNNQSYIKEAPMAFPQDGADYIPDSYKINSNNMDYVSKENYTTETTRKFLTNLSMFLTLPERVYVERNRVKSRVKKGLAPRLPNSKYITCTNKMKIYMNKYEEAVESGGRAVQKHRRRGHWRKLTSPRFKHVPYTERADGSIGKFVWVRPTVVGSGVYLPRHRRVKD